MRVAFLICAALVFGSSVMATVPFAFFPVPGGASGSGVTVDTVSTNSTTTTNATWSHTCSGSDRVLFVGVSALLGANNVSVTYNGTAMTKVWFIADADGVMQSTGFVLASPATGAHNIVATFGAAPTGAGLGAVSFTGCDTTTPTNGVAVTAANVAAANGSVTVTGVGAPDMVVDCFSLFATSITANAGQVVRVKADNLFSNTQSYEVSTKTGSGSLVLGATHTSSHFATGAIAIKSKP